MTKEQALEELKKCHTGDHEDDHFNADEILCKLLIALGCDEVVEEFEKIGKWYA